MNIETIIINVLTFVSIKNITKFKYYFNFNFIHYIMRFIFIEVK